MSLVSNSSVRFKVLSTMLALVVATGAAYAQTSTTKTAKPSTVNTTLDILRTILTQPAAETSGEAEKTETPAGSTASEATTATSSEAASSSQSATTTSQASAGTATQTVVELKKENEDLKRQLDVLRDYERRETVRRIEDLKLRHSRLGSDIDVMQRERDAMSAHIEYLEKTVGITEETQATSQTQGK